MPAAHKPTDDSRRQVNSMAGIGLPHTQICLVLGIKDKHTLYKYYQSELDQGGAMGDLGLARSLYDQAVGRPAEFETARNGRKRKVKDEIKPDRSVAIFLAKVRLGYKDKIQVPMGADDLDLAKLNDEEAEQLAALLRKAAKTALDAAKPAGGDGG